MNVMTLNLFGIQSEPNSELEQYDQDQSFLLPITPYGFPTTNHTITTVRAENKQIKSQNYLKIILLLQKKSYHLMKMLKI